MRVDIRSAASVDALRSRLDDRWVVDGHSIGVASFLARFLAMTDSQGCEDRRAACARRLGSDGSDPHRSGRRCTNRRGLTVYVVYQIAMTILTKALPGSL